MDTQEKQALITNQVDLQNKIIAIAKINIVNCCHCGSVVLHKIDDEDDMICPYCHEEVSKNDCPDFLYTGLELSGEFEFNK